MRARDDLRHVRAVHGAVAVAMRWLSWRGVRKGPVTRFFIVNTERFGIYLHRIDRPDLDRDCHDHPWSFVTIVLRGGYKEERREPSCSRIARWRWRFSVAYRHRTDAHRIAVVLPNTWTLVIRGRDTLTWGFYRDVGHGLTRWIDWRQYRSVAGA